MHRIPFTLVLVLLWFGLTASILQGATLKVSGTGWWSDFQLERNLRLFFGGRETESGFGASELMDASILLGSALQKNGFLNAEITVDAITPDGEIYSFSDLDEVWDETEILENAEIDTVRFRVHRGPRSTFGSIRFVGQEPLPMKEREALGYFYPQQLLLPSARYRIYSMENQNRGVSNLRRSLVNQGYREAKVEATVEELGEAGAEVSLQVRVDPGPLHVVSAIDPVIDAGPGMDPQVDLTAVRERFSERIGDPWTPFLERELRTATLNAFYGRGYADARLTLNAERQERQSERQPVRVRIAVTPGTPSRISAVTLEGLERTRRKTVTRELTFVEGDWFNPEDLDESRRALYRLGIFESIRAEVEAVPGPDDGTTEERAVVFHFEEALRREWILRGGIGSYEKVRAGVTWEYKNLWGRAHRLRTQARGSLKSANLGVDYLVPRLGNTPVDATFSAEWLRREEVSFDREEWSLGARLNGTSRRFGFRYFGGYSLKSLNSRNADQLSEIGNTRFRSGGLELGLFRDRRNSPVLPTRGYRWRANLDWVSPVFGAESNFQRLRLNGSRHWEWGGWQWNAGLSHELIFSLGSIESEVPVNARIFAGGENSIRGYREGRASPRDSDGNLIGALQASVLNLEVERPVTPQVNAVLFYDGLLQGAREDQYPGNEYLHSLGVGLRFLTPIGPVRMEYGHNLNPRPEDGSGAFHFSLGFPF